MHPRKSLNLFADCLDTTFEYKHLNSTLTDRNPGRAYEEILT